MNILEKLAIHDDDYHGYITTKWINPDISPLPPSRRTWGYVDYLGFWQVLPTHLDVRNRSNLD